MQSNFSIIIPTYNSCSTIKNCIDSVLSQTFLGFEILIMDGLSSDNTIEIVNKYKDDRIKIYSEKDSGVYDAMNKGINLASGKWLYFLGSDDAIFDNDVLLTIAGYTKINDCDIVYGNAYFIGRKYFHDGKFDRIKLTNEKNICHQAIFYNHSIFEKIGYYNLEFPINADWDFNLRCFSRPDLRISYIDLPIVNYNDVTGLSDSGINDVNFHKISGAKLSRTIRELQQEIDKKDSYIQKLEKSNSYRIGNFLLSPFKLIRKLFNC